MANEKTLEWKQKSKLETKNGIREGYPTSSIWENYKWRNIMWKRDKDKNSISEKGQKKTVLLAYVKFMKKRLFKYFLMGIMLYGDKMWTLGNSVEAKLKH